MKNADMPAMPIEREIIDNSGNYTGLTKREHFAAMAMQGMLSSKYVSDFSGESIAECMADAIAATALKYADALLTQLEQTK